MSLFGSGKKERATVSESGFFSGVHSGMGLASKGLFLAFVVFTALNFELANDISSAVRSWIKTTLAWYYIGAVTFMLFTCLYLMFSHFGKLRLGGDDSRTAFSNFSRFAMLFSAGVGISLLFLLHRRAVVLLR
jgi:choline/glycine/proline betaine transport protein